ncbi:MAG: hypothetical protein IPP60_10470 [Sphingobacteriales bacterium]|nr:hypothetical protein [Sphingobacteriales bacterium]
MKKTSIRSIVTMLVIFFIVAATSCNKDNKIAPTAPPVPAIPPTPVTPAISLKPIFIETKENGNTIRKQSYAYDSQGKLAKYESSTGVASTSDSVLVRQNNVSFKTPGSNTINQSLTFNADKTFDALFSATDQIDFENNQTKLSRMTKARPNSTPLNVGVFNYTNNNLSSIGAEIRIDINYHDNLPYQKGINEIPIALKPVKFYKIIEMENTTTSVLYSKLIRQVILDFGNRRELHDYTYTFDTNNRVTQIRDTQTTVTSTSSVQKVFISSVSYAQN